MAGEISKPHDHLFRSVFRDESEAAALLRAHLPEPVAGSVRWSSLARQDVTFIDDRLRDSESDLLFAVRRKTDGAPAWRRLAKGRSQSRSLTMNHLGQLAPTLRSHIRRTGHRRVLRVGLGQHKAAGFYRRAGMRQPSATSNAATLRVWRLNSTPIRWIGSPRSRYLAA